MRAKLYEYRGEQLTLRQIAARHGLTRTTLHSVLRSCNGDLEEAIQRCSLRRKEDIGTVLQENDELICLCAASINAFCEQCPYLKRTICKNPTCELYKVRIELRKRE